jgi:hypothetical protein
MKFRGGEFSTGITGNVQPELTSATRGLSEQPFQRNGNLVRQAPF